MSISTDPGRIIDLIIYARYVQSVSSQLQRRKIGKEYSEISVFR
ncbi:MAG TPA: hypothetical protein VI033_04910 [Candidatus Nitrosopolaris sp.]